MAITRCHHRSLPALFLLLLVVFLSVSTAEKQERSSGDDVDLAGSALVDWIRASGGHSDVRAGLVVDAPAGAEPTSTKTVKKRRRGRRGKKESKSGSSSSSSSGGGNSSGGALRGTIATRDIAAGEAIIRLPSNLSVPLGGMGVTSPVRGRARSARVFSFLSFPLSLSLLSLSRSQRRRALLTTALLSTLKINTTPSGKRRPAVCSARGRPGVVSRARSLLGLAPCIGLHQGDVRARAYGSPAGRGAGKWKNK